MRRQIEARQNRASTGSSWFRVGVLSATVIAPLIARWNDLRTSNRAQTLRDLAAARLSDARDARDQAAVRLAPMAAAANARLSDARDLANAQLSTVRDLASARLDDARAVAGAGLDVALDRLAQVPAPDALRNVLPFSLATKRAQELERQRQARRRQTTMWWLAGVGIGLVAAGATAFVIARRRMALPLEDDEPMVELPTERSLAEATVGASSTMRNSFATSSEQAEISVPVRTFAGMATADNARYIGNTHTRVFHDVDDTDHLPSEENRIYFASEDEARQAGYHHAGEPESSTENQ